MLNGRRIRQARELAGLSREELAEAAGISAALLTRYEHGSAPTPLSEEVAEALAMRCGFPVSFFHKDEPPDFPVGSLLFHEIAEKRAEEARARGERVCNCGRLLNDWELWCYACGWPDEIEIESEGRDDG